MPIVLPYTPEDLADVVRVFESHDVGLDPKKFPLPDFTWPLIITNFVARTDSGQFIACAYNRLLVETSLIIDPRVADVATRIAAFKALHDASYQVLVDRGVDRAVAMIGPEPKNFGAILEKNGWEEVKDRKTYTFLL